MSAQVLREKDVNTQMPDSQPALDSTKAPKFPSESEQKQSYVSPSDAIMSPASKKLSDFKQRQANGGRRNGAPLQRALFAKAVTARQKDLGAN